MLTLVLPFLVLLLALVIVAAACSACETAIFSLTGADRIRLRKTHPQTERLVAKLMAAPRRFLVGVLVLNTLAAVGYAVASTAIANNFESAAATIAFQTCTFLVLVLGAEVLPKQFAAAAPATIAVLLAPLFARAFAVLSIPLAIIDSGIIGPMSRLIAPAREDDEPLSTEELSALLTIGAGPAGLDQREQLVLSQVLRLGEIRVRDVMAPRVDIRWVGEKATSDDIARLVRTSGHSRFPVCKGSLDGVVLGMLHAKEYFRHSPTGGQRREAGAFAEPAVFVPDKAKLDKLLEVFRQSHTHVALCVDEFGQITGLIEVEDVVRRLMAPEAELENEWAGAVQEISPGVWRVPGRLSIRHWAELFGTAGWRKAIGERAARERRISTLAGLMFSRLGRLPKVGDEVVLGNVRLSVESVEGRTIGNVRVWLTGQGQRDLAGGAA
ncbi:MAG: hemolysin family protein [Planctomycetota bacterium]